MIQNKLKKITIASLLGSFSLVISFISIQIPFIPYFKLEISDFPIYFINSIFNSRLSIYLLLVISFLRSFFFGHGGWLGFLIRFFSIFIIYALIFYKKSKLNTKKNKIYLVLCFVMIILFIMIKVSFVYFLFIQLKIVPKKLFDDLLIFLLLLSNTFKVLFNIILSNFFHKKISKIEIKNYFSNNL